MCAQHKDEINPKMCWSLVERVAASPHLKRASRLREFLLYVAGKSLKDGFVDLHEQELGHDVFGRDLHYDTSQDNIVRVNATELRKRIDAFFEGEGVNEPLIFEIPRGSYTPVFRWRAQPEKAVPAPVSVPVHQASPLPYQRVPLILASALALLLAVTSIVLWMENQSLRKSPDRWEGKPALGAFWPRFLNSSRETDIILADTSFAYIEDITKQRYTLTDYLNRDYIRQIQSSDSSSDRKADLTLIATRSNGSLGDFRVAQRIRSLDPASTKLFMEYAREYTADSVKRNNVILIGSQISNPWVDLFYSELAFTIEKDPALDQSFVKNISPHPGEQSLYTVVANPDATVGYSIIAYLPNPSHTADALIIAGTNSQATDAAGEFLASESSMEQFLKKIPAKQMPYFEILLKTTRLSGTPFSAEIVAFRTY
jgi:hypothetical protein